MRSSSLPSLIRSIESSRCLLGRAASPYLETAMRSTTANTMRQRILATQKRIWHTRLCNLDTTPDLFRGAKNRETLNQVLTTHIMLRALGEGCLGIEAIVIGK